MVRAAAAYFGLAIKVSCPGPAASIPAIPLISVSGEPFSSRVPSTRLISERFILQMIVKGKDFNRRDRRDFAENTERERVRDGTAPHTKMRPNHPGYYLITIDVVRS